MTGVQTCALPISVLLLHDADHVVVALGAVLVLGVLVVVLVEDDRDAELVVELLVTRTVRLQVVGDLLAG